MSKDRFIEKAFTRRAEFAKTIRGHWSLRLLAWAWGVLGTLNIIRDKFLPAGLQQSSETSAFFPQFPWYIWIIGFLTILVAMIFEGALRTYGKEPEAASRSSPGQATSSPDLSIASTAGISSNASPAISPANSPASSLSAPHLTSDLKKHPQPQKPNLICIGTKIAHIDFIQSKAVGEVFIESDNKMVPRGIIACFRNERSGSHGVADAKSVRARVNFRDVRGREVGNEIASACWLEHHPDSISFALGEHQCVLLGMIEMGRTLRVPWKRRHRVLMGIAFSTEWETIFEPTSIEVRLVGGDNELLADPLLLDITFEDRNAHIVLRKPCVGF